MGTDNNQVVAALAQDVITQVAPQELPLFRAQSAAYFKDPAKALKPTVDQDLPLGFGSGELVVLLTPVVLAVAAEVVKLLAEDVRSALVAEGVHVVGEKMSGHVNALLKRPASDKSSSLALTKEQIIDVHAQAYARFRGFGLSEAEANRLADALAVSLLKAAVEERKL